MKTKTRADAHLTRHFSEWEFLRSGTASRLGINNHWERKQHCHNAILLCEALEKIREIWGQPLIIMSGYRSRRLNRAVGGAKYSKHLTGRAVDFYIHEVPLQTVYNKIKDHNGGLAINQRAGYIHIDTGAKRRWTYS